MQMAGGVAVNSDGGLERDADVMGGRATQMKRVGQRAKPDSETAQQPVAAQLEAPIQMKIKVGEGFYSFAQVYDLAGNPFLSPKSPEKGEEGKYLYKLAMEQPGIVINKTPLADVATPSGDKANHARIFHNIARGRPQIVKNEDRTSVLAPFKSYTFGYETRPEVAHYKLNEDAPKVARGSAQKYPEFFREITKILLETAKTNSGLINIEVIDGRLEEVHKDLKSIVLAEEYRTPGALDHLENRWGEMLKKLNGERLPQQIGARARPEFHLSPELESIVRSATSNLIFAGDEGKNIFREHVMKEGNKSIAQVDNFPIVDPYASDDEDNTGVTVVDAPVDGNSQESMQIEAPSGESNSSSGISITKKRSRF